jgi:ammonium transporter, Amt family
MTMNGCLTGLVAITAPCASVDTWAAVVIGIVAGWVYMFASKLLVKLRIDDAVDAVPVHMFGGAWGVIAAGLFSKPDLLERAYSLTDHVGWFYEWGRGSGNFTLIGIQLIGVLFILGWVGGVMGVFFYILNFFGMLRVSPLEEEAGMDISRHKGSAYDIPPANDDAIKQLTSSRHGGSTHVIPAATTAAAPTEKQETIAAAATEKQETIAAAAPDDGGEEAA